MVRDDSNIMKNFFEKLISPSKKPELYLGFSGTSLRWVVSAGNKDSQGRIVVDDIGTVTHFSALPKNLFPKNFLKYLNGSKIHMVVPAGACRHILIPEKIDQSELAQHTSGYVVYQKLITTGTKHNLYVTTSIDMQVLQTQTQVLTEKNITPDQVHHVATSFTVGDDRDPKIIVSFGEVFTWIAWVCDGEILYQEDIPIGKQHIITHIEQKLGITGSEAQKILEKYGITQSHPDKKLLGSIFQILRPITETINTWILEHSRFTYIKQPYQSTPKNTLLVGSACDIAGLAQCIVLQTGISTEIYKAKLLQQYTLPHDHHISDLVEYEPLITLIPRV